MTKDDLEAIFDRVRAWPAEKQAAAIDVLEHSIKDRRFTACLTKSAQQ